MSASIDPDRTRYVRMLTNIASLPFATWLPSAGSRLGELRECAQLSVEPGGVPVGRLGVDPAARAEPHHVAADRLRAPPRGGQAHQVTALRPGRAPLLAHHIAVTGDAPDLEADVRERAQVHR